MLTTYRPRTKRISNVQTSNTDLMAASPKSLQQITWREIIILYSKEKPSWLFKHSCHKLNTPAPFSRFAKFMLNSSQDTGDFTVALSTFPHAYWCINQSCHKVTWAFVSSATLFSAVCSMCVGSDKSCHGQWVTFGIKSSETFNLQSEFNIVKHFASPKEQICCFLWQRNFFMAYADLGSKSLEDWICEFVYKLSLKQIIS